MDPGDRRAVPLKILPLASFLCGIREFWQASSVRGACFQRLRRCIGAMQTQVIDRLKPPLPRTTAQKEKKYSASSDPQRVAGHARRRGQYASLCHPLSRNPAGDMTGSSSHKRVSESRHSSRRYGLKGASLLAVVASVVVRRHPQPAPRAPQPLRFLRRG